jgi:hypothetical protein
MPTTIAPLVGAYFRKPALAILANLAAGTPLSLVAEPDNPHSKNGMAIKVILTAANVPHGPEIEAACVAQGTFPEDLYANDWHLGYIAEATGENAVLYPKLAAVTSATLTFAATGKPQVAVLFSELEQASHD